MATLPTVASLTGATTTNAQQKTNFTALQTFLSDLLGTDSANKVAARAALGALGLPDFPSTLAGTGSYTFPGGLILKWGSVTHANGGVATNPTAVTFATSFPSAIFQTFLINANGPSSAVVSCNSSSTTGFNAFSTANSIVSAWFALGK